MARVQSLLDDNDADLLADIVYREQAEPTSFRMRLRVFIGKSARVVGQVWTGGVVLAVLVVCLFEMMPSFDRGTIANAHGNLGHLYLLATLAMPGYALFRWGSVRLDAHAARTRRP